MREKIVYVMMFLFLTTVYSANVYAAKDPAIKYTRIGSEAEGNKSGEITAFEGDAGLPVPANFKKGQWLPNPYKSEKPLFRIDYKNVDKYSDRLTVGQVVRLKKNKKSYMDIYLTHRNSVYAEAFYRATEKNIATCRLDANKMLVGWNGGTPFPYPDDAQQMIMNLKRQYVADDAIGVELRRVVSPSGKIKKTIWDTQLLTFGGRITGQIPNPDGVNTKITALYIYPADTAGTCLLKINYMDDRRQDDSWLYIPTLRRVRRAPSMTKGGQIDGESTMDELSAGFSGFIADWDWKFLGKKEIYVPMNCFEMYKVGGKDEDEVWPGDMSPVGARWELRRMWVVQGTIKPGISHPYSRRVEYIDEDTWSPTMGDRYDRRGNLWRMYAFYVYPDYYQKVRAVAAHIYMNLESGRYELKGGGRTKDSQISLSNTGMNPENFTVQSLRRAGR